MRTILAASLTAAVLGGCRDLPAVRLYETTATVRQEGDRLPELCLGFMTLTDPPQCGGPPIQGWDWGDVEGEETGKALDGPFDVTYGEYHVTGSYDGHTFVVVDAGPPQREDEGEEDEVSFDTPCPKPAGGWTITDPRRASEETVVPDRVERDQPDFAGTWVDYDGDIVILNVAFTGSLKRHERELRKVWGGALCVSRAERSHRELESTRRSVQREFDLETLWSSLLESEGRVELGVVVLDDATRAAIKERYGGVVEVEEQLQPAE